MDKIYGYPIEKGVPLPDNDKEQPIPLTEMEVGDSILLSKEKRPNVASRASKLRAKGMKFTIKAVDEDNCRVWRIE